MTPEKALELASQYGIMNVVLILVLFFFAGFILYVMRVQERRDNRLFDLVEKKMKDTEDRTQERHIATQAAMTTLAEADKRQREEHEQILRNQSDKMTQIQKISSILDGISARLKT